VTSKDQLQIRFTLGQRVAIAIIPRLVAFFLRIVGMTLRFQVIAEEGAVPAESPPKGIFCFWHQCTLPCAYYFRNYPVVIMISRSFDGELITRTLARFGYQAARGSSSRGGGGAFLQLKNALEGDMGVIFTADGPRGPIYKSKSGPVRLAQLTGEPIGSFYLLPERRWTINSWDRFFVPKPFSRVIVSWSRTVLVPPSADDAQLEEKRQELDAALERARKNAERQVALSHSM
jgi:lysophospholipid acyltransferase (LPLAT)-like uncharacterized protein